MFDYLGGAGGGFFLMWKNGQTDEDSNGQRFLYSRSVDAVNWTTPMVFLPNLTDETSLEPMKNAKDEEERRLFFVAVTRARQRLYLSFHGTPHRFLEEIPWEYVDEFSPARRSY